MGIDGNSLYVAGLTTSSDFPAIIGAYDTSLGGSKDAFISKLSGDLKTILASTYLGGSSDDFVIDYDRSMLLDAGGNVFVAGVTSSPDFPTTSGAYDTSYDGVMDIFVSKLSNDLMNLQASTYLGGTLHDYGGSIAIGSTGNIYIVGQTESSDFPTTLNTNIGGYRDAVVSMLSGDLKLMLASRHLGGSSIDDGHAIALDKNVNVYVVGTTHSTDFPTTPGAYDTAPSGSVDAFVSKLGGDLKTIIASTYLGGPSGYDEGRCLVIDSGGNVYVGGSTAASDFPTLPGAFDTSHNGGFDDYVSCLNGGLTSLLASTYLGGSSDDYISSMVIDTGGNVYVTGNTWSSDFPTTSSAYDTSYNGNDDAFVAKFNASLTTLLASTYLGGSSEEVGYALLMDIGRNIYVTGNTGSSEFPTTPEAYDTSFNGGVDVFVSKLDGNLSANPFNLSFSPINSPQAVGVPFEVTITAKDTNGKIKTDFSGEVSLWSNAGAIYPVSASLTQGQWTGNVTLYEAGSGIHLGASGGGRSGTSNDFNVIGQGSGMGKLMGEVWDNVGKKLSGANVYLEKSEAVSKPQGNYHENQNQRNVSIKYPTSTDNQGKYSFTNIPSGDYSLWADFNNKLSDQFKIFIPEDKTIFKDKIIITINTDDVHDPVILVPGILGSRSRGIIYPYLPAEYPANANDLELHDFNIPKIHKPGWLPLMESLKNEGYTNFNTIIPCPYDWRWPLDEAVEKYLIPCIDKAKQSTGKEKVDIIAHSMGGLLVRAYIQGYNGKDWYKDRLDIRKFAMVGTPNLGAPLVYYMWEGGDPYSVDSAFPYLYVNVSEYLYAEMLDKQVYTTFDKPGSTVAIKLRKFYHDLVTTIGQLLSTEAFLLKNGSLTPQKIPPPENNKFLENLNSDPNRFRMGTDTSKIETGIFAGTGQPTRNQIYVQSPNSLYVDGVPIRNEYGDGDETVGIKSATWPCDDGFASCKGTKTALHADLIGVFKNELVQFLKGDTLEHEISTNSDKSQEVSTSLESPGKNAISLFINGRVQPYIVNPDGKASGINPKSGNGVNTIKKTTVSIGVDAGSISIENPINGTYTVYLKGIYNEDFSLHVGYVDKKENKFLDYAGFNHADTTSFIFTLDSTNQEKVVINNSPLPPTNLQADAIDAEGLKTRLTWESSASTGYNIYSKEEDEPYLKLIGNTKKQYYETDHPWAENASIRTRIYTVSAVKKNGKESFLSNMAENNDRDHDGLPDEKEVALGTDVNNPDSDGDTLKDGEEYVYGTDPLKADTDEDLYNDYAEVKAGSDPLSKDSIPSILGSVTDTEDNPLESVNLKLVGENTMVSLSTVSDVDGFFGFANLGEDTYKIAAKKTGYKNASKKVAIGNGELKEITIKMKKR